MFFNTVNKKLAAWIEDNRLFMNAYYAAGKDESLENEIEELEMKYIRKHLAETAGEEEADRIMAERGL